MVKSVGKPDARKGHVRFDERGRETGGCQQAPHRALPRLYVRPNGQVIGDEPGDTNPERHKQVPESEKTILSNPPQTSTSACSPGARRFCSQYSGPCIVHSILMNWFP